jgi:hypothetical protein
VKRVDVDVRENNSLGIWQPSDLGGLVVQYGSMTFAHTTFAQTTFAYGDICPDDICP